MILDKLFPVDGRQACLGYLLSAGVPIHQDPGQRFSVNQQVLDPAMIEKMP